MLNNSFIQLGTVILANIIKTEVNLDFLGGTFSPSITYMWDSKQTTVPMFTLMRICHPVQRCALLTCFNNYCTTMEVYGTETVATLKFVNTENTFTIS